MSLIFRLLKKTKSLLKKKESEGYHLERSVAKHISACRLNKVLGSPVGSNMNSHKHVDFGEITPTHPLLNSVTCKSRQKPINVRN